MADGDEEQTPERRIRHARETAAVLERILREPTQQNAAAFHELHARHLRELGDDDAAARAEKRATRARRPAADHYSLSPSGAIVRTVRDAQRRHLADDVTGATDETKVGEDRSADADAPGESVERARPGGAIQVQHAEAALQRADAALQRAVEGTGRAEASAAREKSARQRSDAARRRLDATGSRAAAGALRSQLAERDDVADERERIADERERIADERDSRADSRDKVADKRDKVADAREKTADKRDTIADERERFAVLRPA